MGQGEVKLVKVLVTGGGGFLGTEICKELLKSNFEVFSFSRSHYSHLDDLGVTTRRGSLTSLSDIKIALNGIDAVIHTAAIAGVWGKKQDFYDTNYIGTKNLVDTCLSQNIKYFINTSSPSVVFGKDDILNGDESIAYPSEYLTSYAKTKSLAESYVLDNCSTDFYALSLRPHLIFGKSDPHIIPRLVESAKKGRLKIVGDGNNLVDVIHVSNAASAHVKALQKLVSDNTISKRSYFIGQETPVNLWDFINKILVLKGHEPIVERISFKKAYFIGHMLELIYSLLGINKPEPPMTRFVATQLAKNHYFSHANAVKDFEYEVKINIEDAIISLGHKS